MDTRYSEENSSTLGRLRDLAYLTIALNEGTTCPSSHSPKPWVPGHSVGRGRGSTCKGMRCYYSCIAVLPSYEAQRPNGSMENGASVHYDTLDCFRCFVQGPADLAKIYVGQMCRWIAVWLYSVRKISTVLLCTCAVCLRRVTHVPKLYALRPYSCDAV